MEADLASFDRVEHHTKTGKTPGQNPSSQGWRRARPHLVSHRDAPDLLAEERPDLLGRGLVQVDLQQLRVLNEGGEGGRERKVEDQCAEIVGH